MHRTVAIIVLNWNGADDTITCVQSLQRLTYPTIRIYIVDNHSSGDDVLRFREQFGDTVTIVENSNNEGYAGGNNRGLSYARNEQDYDYYWILNNDTRVMPDALSAMVTVAETGHCGLVGSHINYWESEDTYCEIGGRYNKWTGIDRLHHNRLQTEQLDYISGCSLLISRKAYQETKGFDKRFFLYNEEVDLCLRAQQQGIRLGRAFDSRVEHHSAKTTGYFSNTYFYYFLRNKILLFKKHSRWYHYPSFILAYLFYYCAGMTLRYTLKNKKFPVHLLYRVAHDVFHQRWSKQRV